MRLTPAAMAALVARDLPDGGHVNLGIGLPTRVAAELAPERDVFVHTENGAVGVVPLPAGVPVDADLVDAGKRPVGLRPGGAYLSHADSFALVRGGHLDVAVMGAFEVSARGDLANWSRNDGLPGVGGAMDLAVATPTVLVLMRHVTREGRPRLVRELSLPVTARGVVDRVYTDLGVFVPSGDGFVATALVDGLAVDDLRAITAAPVDVPSACRRLPVAQPSRHHASTNQSTNRMEHAP